MFHSFFKNKAILPLFRFHCTWMSFSQASFVKGTSINYFLPFLAIFYLPKYIPTVHIISSYFFWPLTSHFSRIICPTYLPKNRKVNWFLKQLLHNLHQLTQFGGISPNLQVCKGSFFSESAICLSNLQEKYSKSLSRTWNLNFPPITVNKLFKFQAQDCDLEYLLWRFLNKSYL